MWEDEDDLFEMQGDETGFRPEAVSRAYFCDALCHNNAPQDSWRMTRMVSATSDAEALEVAAEHIRIINKNGFKVQAYDVSYQEHTMGERGITVSAPADSRRVCGGGL